MPKGLTISLEQEFLESNWLSTHFTTPPLGPFFLELVAKFNHFQKELDVAELTEPGVPDTESKDVAHLCDLVLNRVLWIATLEKRREKLVNIDPLFNVKSIDLEKLHTQYNALEAKIKAQPDAAARFNIYLNFFLASFYEIYFEQYESACPSVRKILRESHELCENSPLSKTLITSLKNTARAKVRSLANQKSLDRIYQEDREKKNYEAVTSKIYEDLIKNSFILLKHAYKLLLKTDANAPDISDVEAEQFAKKSLSILSNNDCDVVHLQVPEAKKQLKDFVIYFFFWIASLYNRNIELGQTPKEFINAIYSEAGGFIKKYWGQIDEPRLLLQLLYAFYFPKPSQRELCEKALTPENKKSYIIASEFFVFYFSSRFTPSPNGLIGALKGLFFTPAVDKKRAEIYENLFKQLFVDGSIHNLKQAIDEAKALSSSNFSVDLSVSVLEETEYTIDKIHQSN